MLGLPKAIRACLFDLDGVLTDTATIHARAWKQTFDDVLRHHNDDVDTTFVPFDATTDYAAHVDGKRRADGVRDFLTSRGITLPEGHRNDDPSQATVAGIGNRKNELLLQLITDEGVTVYPSSKRYLHAVAEAGLRRAVVSSSANAALVLEVTGLEEDIELLVDGSLAHALQLSGKPAPDTYLEAARRLGVEPAQAAVYEDALSGVRAARAGEFGQVIGINRLDHAAELRGAGADLVIDDFEELL